VKNEEAKANTACWGASPEEERKQVGYARAAPCDCYKKIKRACGHMATGSRITMKMGQGQKKLKRELGGGEFDKSGGVGVTIKV